MKVKESIQRKIDEILEMAKAPKSSTTKHVVTPRTRENDNLLKSIRNKEEAEEFMDNLNAVIERAHRQTK